MVKERTSTPQAPAGFIASAVRLPTPSKRDLGSKQRWQADAWNYYDSIPELRYVSNWIGNVMSRAEWHVGKREGDQIVPIDKGPAQDAIDALYSGPQGQKQMTQLLGTDLTVGGEGYVIAKGDLWDVVTTGKVQRKNSDPKAPVQADFGDGMVDLKPSDLAIRIWTPHPTNAKIADAPTRSNLRTMAQIAGYDDHIGAQLTSRLAGAGVWMLPSEVEFAPDPDADPEASTADGVMAKLHEAMEAAKADRTSPAAFVPIVFTLPGELIQYAKDGYMTFWSELDRSVIEMRDAAIRRFGIGMDVPPEVLLGNAESNHWNAWLSEESAIKAHLEPRLSVIAHGLTTQYLRPSLKGTPAESEADLYYVIADTSPIRTRPNRSSEAMELHDRGMLNDRRVLLETGFHPDDMPNEDERVRWLLERIALGAVTPEITAEALRLLGAPITATSAEPQDQPRQTLPAPGDDTNQRTPPDQTERQRIRDRESERELAAACEVLVYRALERAGNKLKNHHKLNGSVKEPDAVYLTYTGDHDQLLDGAWDCAPKVLGDYGVDIDEVVDTLDFYVRGLLSTKREHSKTTMVRLLRSAQVEV